VDFDIAVMTNVNHEHLEFHGTWEQYRSDKAELFRALDSSPSSHRKQGPAGKIEIPSFGVMNADDPSAAFFAAATRHRTYTFSTRGASADLSVRLMENGIRGNRCEVIAGGSSVALSDQLPGAFNAGNVLASLLVVSNLLSIKIENLAPLVPRLHPVRGRMTAIQRGQPFDVLVDYAHTPSSFEAILPPLKKQLKAKGGRLICLFGSAGERDTQKRPLQGEIAARYCDFVILSDEDPRGEEPMSILEEIAAGCFASSGCGQMIRNETLFLIPDRPQAIRKAFSIARKGDLVLLLGKGHENSIIYVKETIAYDEIKEAEKALEEALDI
jgi:UDP-N-acetylmuramoyl-L-alanyl-D-glutamate--2,6-diaminopimelate ligase